MNSSVMDKKVKFLIPQIQNLFDPKIPMNFGQKLMGQYIFSSQKKLDRQHEKIGLADKKGYTCTCFFQNTYNMLR